ncbi:DUF4376 domain-containing protein [Aliamphritea hakodatensis]|uniref:DUF4376 domain-containing protein n=1 Tax=Aliamphritea hakodatensis TaxID=2895352 RepID=UPI0022FD7463|nr:DUF4376 domain-containing protein [Aliamphritea hakodatensis]
MNQANQLFSREVNKARQKRLESNLVEFKGYHWQADPMSLLLIVGAVLGLVVDPDKPGIEWMTGENVKVELSQDEFIQLSQAILAHVSDAYAWSWMMKEQLGQCADINEALQLLNEMKDGK